MLKILISAIVVILSLVFLFITLKKNCKKGFIKYLVPVLVLVLSFAPAIVLRLIPNYNKDYDLLNPDEILITSIFILLVSIVIFLFLFLKNHSEKSYPKYIFLGVSVVLFAVVLFFCFGQFGLIFSSVESAHRFEYKEEPLIYTEGKDSVFCLRESGSGFDTDIIAKSGNKFKLDDSEFYISDKRLHYGFTAEVKSYDLSDDYYITLYLGDFNGAPDDVKIDIPKDIKDLKLSDSLGSQFKFYQAENVIIAIAHLNGCTPKILKSSYTITINGTEIKFDDLMKEDDCHLRHEN